MITQHVERSSQEQAKGGRQITVAIEQISNMVNALNASQRAQTKGGEQLTELARRLSELANAQSGHLKALRAAHVRLNRVLGVEA
jgi:methyl-accepting chemotaxis protein